MASLDQPISVVMIHGFPYYYCFIVDHEEKRTIVNSNSSDHDNSGVILVTAHKRFVLTTILDQRSTPLLVDDFCM